MYTVEKNKTQSQNLVPQSQALCDDDDDAPLAIAGGRVNRECIHAHACRW